jgi:NAD(P)-dependent dehydrogenase (short-subunit alcohol dehydrogenase family)
VNSDRQLSFDGKVALVTGGSSGIGRAAAEAFARAGARTVVSDVDEAGGNETVEAIQAAGGTATFVKCDVSSAADVENMVRHARSAYGRLDCAFNNAGIEGELANTVDCTEENWDRTLEINLKGVWLCMKYEIPVMLEHGGGSIVNCASVAGLVGFRNLPAYCASKGGVVELTRATALEYSDAGIRVNAICPGVIRTPMVERVTAGNPEVEAQYTALEPIGRMGEPDEIADAALWLCSDHSSFIIGHALAADGGLVAQ